MDENTLTDQSPLYNDPELSSFELPLEYKVHFLLRYCYKLQNTNTLLDDELSHLQALWDGLERKSYRNQELEQQNSELRRTIKQMSVQINELTLKVLSNNKRK